MRAGDGNVDLKSLILCIDCYSMASKVQDWLLKDKNIIFGIFLLWMSKRVSYLEELFMLKNSAGDSRAIVYKLSTYALIKINSQSGCLNST